MLKIFTSTHGLRYSQLMEVYAQLNKQKANGYRNTDRNAALVAAEQDLYDYLKHCFFKRQGSFLAVWENNGIYTSAVRVERYRDGWLINALETAPDCRRKGYARQLLRAALADLEEPVYSHVHKDNAASLALHAHCGFVVTAEESELLNGSVSKEYYTLTRRKEM